MHRADRHNERDARVDGNPNHLQVHECLPIERNTPVSPGKESQSSLYAYCDARNRPFKIAGRVARHVNQCESQAMSPEVKVELDCSIRLRRSNFAVTLNPSSLLRPSVR